MVIRELITTKQVTTRSKASSCLEHDLLAKRIRSLCDTRLAVLHSGSLANRAIGQGLAAARV